jgi:(R,R)-butanediol dehydrogenase/meso-butanediol dehydrogenase/diacetyl reductase
MQAAYYMGNRRVEIHDAEGVPPAPGMVELEVAYTGICGTDLHIVHGAMDGRVSPPAILGHEPAVLQRPETASRTGTPATR